MMKRFDLWKLSLLNVFSSPVRSLLTVLGFAVGIAAVLAVMTLGDAGKQQVQSEMGRLGINKVWLRAAEGNSLSQKTGEWLAETLDMETYELVYLPEEVVAPNGKRASITMVGCNEAYLSQAALLDGRLFISHEWTGAGQKALAGKKLADELGIAVDDFIRLGNKTYEICGILDASECVSTVALEDAVVLPLNEACLRTGGAIHEIQLNHTSEFPLSIARRRVEALLKQQEITAHTETMEIQMEAASSVIHTFVNVLKWVSLVCILVGGVGVMNILLVSVRERKREIGIMKSMGTTPMQICVLFLLEALVYAVIGGFLGILLGLGLIDAAGKSIELYTHARVGDCIAVLESALAVGLFFGVAPAYRASRLTCVDALRQE